MFQYVIYAEKLGKFYAHFHLITGKCTRHLAENVSIIFEILNCIVYYVVIKLVVC